MKRNVLVLLALSCIVACCTVYAEAKVAWNRIAYDGPVTQQEIAKATRQYLKRHYLMADMILEARCADAESLALLARNYPAVTRLEIADSPEVADLAFAAAFTNITVLGISNMNPTDLSRLAECPKLEWLNMVKCKLPDLAAFASLGKVKFVGLEDSELTDFSPLGKMASLEAVSFRGVKGPPTLWATLGELKQVKRFFGGRTQMRSIAWVKGTSQMEELRLFAEQIDNWQPISSAKNLKKLDVRAMRSMVDAPDIRRCPSLETLVLLGSPVSRVKDLLGCASLKVIDVGGVTPAIDDDTLRAFEARGVKVIR